MKPDIVQDHLVNQALVNIHRDPVLKLDAGQMSPEDVAVIERALLEGRIKIHAEKSEFLTSGRPHPIFRTLINGVPREVWSIPGKLDPLQVANDSTSEYWIRLEDDADPATAGEKGDTGWRYYLYNHMFRGCWGISIKENHKTKIKWDELDVSKQVVGELTYNNVLVYKQYGFDAEYVLSCLQRKKIEIWEHPLGITGFVDGIEDDIVGRKIYFMDQPGVITSFNLDECRVGVRYVGGPQKDKFGRDIDGFDMIDRKDIDENEEYEAGRSNCQPLPYYEGHGNEYVYDSVFAEGYFDWFRTKTYPGDEEVAE